MKVPDFWNHQGHPLSLVLAPLGWGYHLAGVVRRVVTTPWKTSVPVICIGNLTAGGTGKTPVAIALAAKLQKKGVRPHFLTRGYGGSVTGPVEVEAEKHNCSEVGDEALLLAGQAPTWVCADRRKGAEAAALGGADLVIMDDGFQNPSLEKDLSLVVVDGGVGFGNGHMIPAGPLRETVSGGLSRADGLVIVGSDDQNLANQNLPVIKASFKPGREAKGISGKKVFAFAGIGRPSKFYQTLENIGCEIVGTKDFPDHHPFSQEEIEGLIKEAAALDARLVTTEKDAVRLPKNHQETIAVLTISLQWENEAELDTLLGKLFT
ncbi:MAG: tetraacyldisaccharide 4'-kinase [Rhodospirillales bacterium]|nr:tetraacyldisaccharide 4'-kinase [Rhodospirillales bacterium]